MEKYMICLDTSVLIDYYRKKDKSKSLLYALSGEYSSFAVSAITAYEIYVGSSPEQDKYWDDFFTHILVLWLGSWQIVLPRRSEAEVGHVGQL